MLEHVHKHIISELQQSAKTDIIFILSSIVLNLITLAINSGSVDKSRTDETILVIAHDVGFNSRSSFYNAFKREMNTTPSALRASRAAADPAS